MKSILRLVICAFPVMGAWSTENAVPTPAPTGRYATMGKVCPFAVASTAEAPAAPQASFAANWYVTGIGRLDDADFVTIKARDVSTQFSLYGTEPNAQFGVVLACIHWTDVVGKSTVVLRKGAETANLEFNEAEVHGPAQVPATAGTSPTGKPGAIPAPSLPGTRPLPAAGMNGTPPPRTLKLAQPPTNMTPPPRNPATAPGVSYPTANGVPRRISPGLHRTVIPPN